MSRGPVPTIVYPPESLPSSAQISTMPVPTTPTIHPQTQSLLFRFPLELRRMIFAHVFALERLSWDRTHASTPNPVALLATCRRAHSEVGDAWLSNATFGFPCRSRTLRRLHNLPDGVAERLRHLYVTVSSATTQSGVMGRTVHCVDACAAVLPRLRLDALMVRSENVGGSSHNMLEQLIKTECGWRELRYVYRDHDTPRLPMFRPTSAEMTPLSPQIAYWQRLIEDRDGPSAGSSVRV